MFSISSYRPNYSPLTGSASKAVGILYSGPDQKALARQRVAEIKEQIEALRRMLLLYGGMSAKSVLQQLKQLSSQLKQAAGILRAGTSDGGAAYLDGRDAYAAQQAAADAETTQLSAPAATTSSDPQGSADEKELDATFRALRSLRSMTERLLKQQAPFTSPDR